MMSKNKDRDTNLELLRICAMLSVVLIHFVGNTGNSIKSVEEFSNKWYFFNMVKAFSINAVDVFMLMSGYHMYKRDSVSLKKPLRLLLQLVIYRVFTSYMTFGSAIFNDKSTLKSYLLSILPSLYFIVLYCVVYVFSPYLNIMMTKISDKSAKHLMILMAVILSIYPHVVDIFQIVIGETIEGLNSVALHGDGNGYTLVNFIMMYLIGAYIKKTELHMKPIKALGGYVLVSIAIFALCVGFQYVYHAKTYLAYSYLSPLVILSAMLAFLFFEGLKMPRIAVINWLASPSLSVYFLNDIIMQKVLNVGEYYKKTPCDLLLHMAYMLLTVWAISLAVDMLYSFIATPIQKKIDEHTGKWTLSVRCEEKGNLISK